MITCTPNLIPVITPVLETNRVPKPLIVPMFVILLPLVCPSLINI